MGPAGVSGRACSAVMADAAMVCGWAGEGDDEAPVGSAGLLLVPVASLRPALHNQLLSCLAFHPSAELLAAAGPGQCQHP